MSIPTPTTPTTSFGTWVPCSCSCQGSDTKSTRLILVRIVTLPETPHGQRQTNQANGFRAHLADPTTGQVWVDHVDSQTLLQQRKQLFAPSLLIPLNALPATLASTLLETLPPPSTATQRSTATLDKPNNHQFTGNKPRLDFEWIALPNDDQAPPSSSSTATTVVQPTIHLKCTQRTTSSLRFTWTFVGTPLDPLSAARVMAADLVSPLFRVLHWQILETKHLSQQLEQAKRDLALAQTLVPDPNALRIRPFVELPIPVRRTIDYVTVFADRSRWSQALLPPSHADTLSTARPQSAPPMHAHSQPVTLTMSHSSALPIPRAVHSSPTLAPSTPSSDKAQPPTMPHLPYHLNRDLPSAASSSQMLAFLLSSSQAPDHSQPPPMHLDPTGLSSDLPSSTSTTTAPPRPTAPTLGTATSFLTRAGPNSTALRPPTKSPITLELADSQSQSQSHALATDSPLVQDDPSPPPPLSPRSILASLPPTLIIPSTIPVHSSASLLKSPPSSHRTASSSSVSTASFASQFAVPKSPASADKGLKRRHEDEGQEAAAALPGVGGVGVGSAGLAEDAPTKPKKKKPKQKLF